MMHTQPTEGEFEFIESGVRHIPTGAEMTFYTVFLADGSKGISDDGSVLQRNLGSRLEDGRDYRREDVESMARTVYEKEWHRKCDGNAP